MSRLLLSVSLLIHLSGCLLYVVCLSVCRPIFKSTCLSVWYLSASVWWTPNLSTACLLPLCLHVFLFDVCLPACLSIFFCMLFCLPFYLTACLSICLSVCLFGCLSVSFVSVFLSVSVYYFCFSCQSPLYLYVVLSLILCVHMFFWLYICTVLILNARLLYVFNCKRTRYPTCWAK